MKKRFLLLTLVLITANIFAQLPNTDIWLLDMKITNDTILLKNPVNITHREGYDNQPAFSPDGKFLLFSSIREDKKAHVYKYKLRSRRTKQFTHTATSEYSPTFMPDGQNISVVMVEKDSAQRLWKFPLKGGPPTVIMKDIDSIGYHCWITKDSLAMVMTSNPSVLKLVNVNTQKTKVFAHNVGRCMAVEAIRLYHVQKPMDNFNYLYWNGDYEMQIPSEDFAYMRATLPVIFTGVKSKIMVTVLPTKRNATLLDLSSYGIKNITRIAVNKAGTKMAIVAE